MKTTVFIDGREGTTGLQLERRLAAREDIVLLEIQAEQRKDPVARKKLLNTADVVFLCLPDEAARAAVGLVYNPAVRIIDASNAHRTAPDWDYGFPELSPRHRSAIAASHRVANPGCHATGFISIVYPLVQMGLLPADALLTVHSLTGYSGGGKSMIAQYQGEGREAQLLSPRPYGLSLAHKHLGEMTRICGLAVPPVFSPIVADYYAGIATVVPLHTAALGGLSAAAVHEHLSAYYADARFISVAPFGQSEDGFLSAGALAGTNRLELFVSGHDRQALLIARFDNLGKGASGAAVQNMNIMLGIDEATGLS